MTAHQDTGIWDEGGSAIGRAGRKTVSFIVSPEQHAALLLDSAPPGNSTGYALKLKIKAIEEEYALRGEEVEVRVTLGHCPNDTDGDGDCHLCHRHGGCEKFTRMLCDAGVKLKEGDPIPDPAVRPVDKPSPVAADLWNRLQWAIADFKRTTNTMPRELWVGRKYHAVIMEEVERQSRLPHHSRRVEECMMRGSFDGITLSGLIVRYKPDQEGGVVR